MYADNRTSTYKSSDNNVSPFVLSTVRVICLPCLRSIVTVAFSSLFPPPMTTGERISFRTFFDVSVTVQMRVETDGEWCFCKDTAPFITAWNICCFTHSVHRNMMDQYPFGRRFELFGSNFLFEKHRLIFTKPCEIIQSVVNHGIVGFVFATIKHNETCVADTESSIRMFTSSLAQQVLQKWRVCSRVNAFKF